MASRVGVEGPNGDEAGGSPLSSFLAEDFTTKVAIPDDLEGGAFQWRTLWAFTGPGFLMSIAYLDPGNLEGDLQAGATCGYDLLGILLWASVLGLLLQLLSMRLGIVTGRHLAEICNREYPMVPRVGVWLMVEAAVIGSDIQEVLGSAIALSVLTRGYCPLWLGVLVTLLDTFVFLLLESYGIRKLEALFSVLIGVMALSFGIEFFASEPVALDVLSGVAVPRPFKPDNRLPAIGLIGSVIMPHNLYLHSALVQSRAVDPTHLNKVRSGINYFTIESSIAIFVSFIINIFVVGVFAASAQWGPTCAMEEPLGLTNAGAYLECKYGQFALWVWAVGLLAAGQASTCTGTYAGQFIMQGFLGLRLPPWKRALLTRSIAIVPAALVSLLETDKVDSLNSSLNNLQSLLLPFAVLPLLYFTSRPGIMGSFITSWPHRFLCWAIAAAVLAINLGGVAQFLAHSIDVPAWSYVPMALFAVLYLGLVVFLLVPHHVSRWLSPLLGGGGFKDVIINPSTRPGEDDDGFSREHSDLAGDTDQLLSRISSS